MKKLLTVLVLLLACNNVQAKSHSYNISSGKVLISHTEDEDSITHSIKAVPPPAAINSTEGVTINPIVILPQNSDCTEKPDGFYCMDRSSMLFECAKGIIATTQKCANGCDANTKVCKTGTGI